MSRRREVTSFLPKLKEVEVEADSCREYDGVALMWSWTEQRVRSRDQNRLETMAGDTRYRVCKCSDRKACEKEEKKWVGEECDFRSGRK